MILETTRVPATTSMTRLVLMGLAGTSIEWYDFFLYGLGSALVFPTLFFAKTLPPFVALMASFSTFAVGFFARPVGAVVFGHFGDRMGRKTALAIALVLMGVATTLVGCLPSYATAGVAAPVLLVALRFLQGLAIGGQWGGAMLLIVENAPARRRGFYGSFAQAGAPVGVVLANLAFLLVSAVAPPDAFVAWAWRVPFLLSIALVVLGLYVHFRVEDTAAFRELRRASGGEYAGQGTARAPVLEAFREHSRIIFLAAGSFIATQVVFYVLVTFSIAYGTSPIGLNLSRTTMLTAVLIGSGTMAPTLLLCGALSDRFGRRRIYRIGCVLTGLWAFMVFPLLETGSLLWISVSVAVALGLTGMMYGPQAALFGELFRTRIRYSGASLGYQIGSMLGGALAPLIATSIVATFHATRGVALYIAVACAISFTCVSLLRETSDVSLHEEASGPGRIVSVTGG